MVMVLDWDIQPDYMARFLPNSGHMVKTRKMRKKMVTLLYNATVKDNWFTFMSILSDFQIR